MAMIRRFWYVPLLLAVVVIVPIVPTGWITRVDTTMDASSEVVSKPVIKPAAKPGPKPFSVGDRFKMFYWNYTFGIPSGATGMVTDALSSSSGGCKTGSYGVVFDNFPPNTGYTGYCIAAWQMTAE